MAAGAAEVRDAMGGKHRHIAMTIATQLFLCVCADSLDPWLQLWIVRTLYMRSSGAMTTLASAIKCRLKLIRSVGRPGGARDDIVAGLAHLIADVGIELTGPNRLLSPSFSSD